MEVSLNSKTRAAIEKSTGMSFDAILSSDSETIIKVIEKKTKKRITFDTNPEPKGRIMSRGSMLVGLRRFLMMDIDKELDRIHNK